MADSISILALDTFIDRLSEQEDKLNKLVSHTKAEITLNPNPHKRAPGILFGMPGASLTVTDAVHISDVANFRVVVSFPSCADPDTVTPPSLWTTVGVCGPGVDGFSDKCLWDETVKSNFQKYVRGIMQAQYEFLKRDIIQSVNHIRSNHRYNWSLTNPNKYRATEDCVDTNVAAYLFSSFICSTNPNIYYCEFMDGHMTVLVRSVDFQNACKSVYDALTATLKMDPTTSGIHLQITPVHDARLLPILRMFDVYEPNKKTCGKQLRALLRPYGGENTPFLSSETGVRHIAPYLHNFVKSCMRTCE